MNNSPEAPKMQYEDRSLESRDCERSIALPIPEAGIAVAAAPVLILELKNEFLPLIETSLAEIVAGFDGAGTAFARMGAWLPLVHEDSLSELEKRVVLALGSHSLQLGQFLVCLGQLALEFRKSGSVDEEALLSLEQLIVHASQSRGTRIEVPQANGGGDPLLGEAK